jgi:SNF2 family DNA or RNA helicase
VVLRDLSLINETLSPDLLILGEAQRIKNWRTKIASATKLIPIRYAFVLTGTPLENRLMAALQQARMACNAVGLVHKETEGAPKLDELASLLEDLCLQGRRKAVVFSQWTLMIEMVESRLRKLGLDYVRLHGGVPSAKRGELMDRFREDDAVQVFISTDAGGVGLNLQSTSVLINLDLPWNPVVLEQRIARIHCLGQSEKVQVILMISSEGYEGQVMQLVQGKQNLFDNVIDPEATEDVVGVSAKLPDALMASLLEDSRGFMHAAG